MAVDQRAVRVGREVVVGIDGRPGHAGELPFDEAASVRIHRRVRRCEQVPVVDHAFESKASPHRIGHVPDVDVGPVVVTPALQEGVGAESRGLVLSRVGDVHRAKAQSDHAVSLGERAADLLREVLGELIRRHRVVRVVVVDGQVLGRPQAADAALGVDAREADHAADPDVRRGLVHIPRAQHVRRRDGRPISTVARDRAGMDHGLHAPHGFADGGQVVQISHSMVDAVGRPRAGCPGCARHSRGPEVSLAGACR